MYESMEVARRIHALLSLLLLPHCLLLCCFGDSASSDVGLSTKCYNFDVEYIMVTMLCHTRAQVVVNGQYPGPTIEAREGDQLIINVTNKAMGAMLTIHWHGIHQVATPWADGAAFVTQCPIPYGHSYIYDFRIMAQSGTLFWHAHLTWVRATVYGAFIIRPSHGATYPFFVFNNEATLLLGEWWSEDFTDTESQMDATGGLPRPPDVNTINGKPGLLYKSCIQSDEQFKDTYMLEMTHGNTYLLRVINAALQANFIFAVANHTLCVVEADGAYTKPFNTEEIYLAPGQTMSVLLHGNKAPGWYSMVAYPASSGASVQPIPATSLLLYTGVSGQNGLPCMPDMTSLLDNTPVQLSFHSLIKKHSSILGDVPKQIDRYFFFAISLGVMNDTCPKTLTGSCQGPRNERYVASLNNISYVLPTNGSILEMLYRGEYVATDFPDYPTMPYNYTGEYSVDEGRVWFRPMKATKVSLVSAGQQVELVLQDTKFLSDAGGCRGMPYTCMATASM